MAKMDPSQWNQVKAIFSAAAELPRHERAAYVERACGGNADIAGEVFNLLRAHEDTDTVGILREDEPPCSIGQGEVLAGRFRIVRFVGRGGMGEVYKADDLELGSTVALKILQPDLVKAPEFLNRFRREVQIARQVTHANVCRMFDVGRDYRGNRDCVFLTMEFLDGQTLAEYMQSRGKLDAEAAFPLIRQMADGLSALHAQGIVHRDFKPSNVMIAGSSQGTPRAVISDFGLARTLAAEAPITDLSRAGQVMGTPDYMAPEQLLGQPATPATDVYAFGLVMYEMITGKKAFPGGRAIENAVQRVVEQPSPPQMQAPGITAEWNQVILRCLARDPWERPSPAEVSAALAGTSKLTHSKPKRTGIWKRAAWTAAAVILVLALFAIASRLPERIGTTASNNGMSRQHVALLPLNVLDDDPALRVFGLGLMETITSRLSQFEGTRSQFVVVPASEVRSQGAKTAGEAKKLFQVTAAVEGTLQTEGDRVRLLLTLIDTNEMRQVETIAVDDSRSNALRLQDAAVARLANALNVRLQPKYVREQKEMTPIAPGAYEFYVEARGYLQRSHELKSIESAITLLKRSLELDPQYALAHSGLGQAYLAKYELTRDPKLMEEALKWGRKGLSLNPNLPEAHISMGRIHLGTGHYDEARQDFETAGNLDSRNNEAYQGLANAYSKLKDYNRAEAMYLKAISLRPGDWTGYRYLGLFYYEREQFDKAIAQYLKVIELSPDNAHGYANLGGFYMRAEDWPAAEKYLRRALELDPTRVSTIGNLAKVYYERGQFERAIETYKQAVGPNTRSHMTWGNLGMAYHRVGNREKSREALERAEQLLGSELLMNPKNAELHSYLGYYRAVLGRPNYGDSLRMALELAPENLAMTSRVAEAYALQGEKTRAVDLVKQIVAKGYKIQSLRRSHDLRGLLAAAGIPAEK